MIVLLLLFIWREEGARSIIGLIVGLLFWVMVIALPFYGLAKFSGVGFLGGLAISVGLVGFFWYKARYG